MQQHNKNRCNSTIKPKSILRVKMVTNEGIVSLIRRHSKLRPYFSLYPYRSSTRERGDIFIEVIIALAIIGLVAVGVLVGLAAAAKSNIISDEQTTGESLARAQIEYIQQQPYDSGNTTPFYNVLSSLPTGYSIITPMATRLDPKGDGTGNDDGLQKITVSVQHKGETIFVLEDYKVQR
jgi:type II secretory pathway pseudopilin PulG